MADFISIKHNIPKSLIDTAALQKAIDKATEAGATRVVNMLNKTVSTWEEPPNFEVRKIPGGSGVWYDARSTGGKHFDWVSGGTKPHQETSAKGMVFEWAGRGNYPSKTHQDSLNAYAGVSSKRNVMKNWGTIRLYQLMHPGIWPRDFAGIIMKNEQERILKEIANVVSNMAKHGIYSPGLEK